MLAWIFDSVTLRTVRRIDGNDKHHGGQLIGGILDVDDVGITPVERFF